MYQMRTGGQADLGRAWPLFALEFDRRELLPRLAVRRAMLRGDAELLIVYDEESSIEVAYALVLSRGVYGYVLLKYVAVSPWFREKGVGLETMRLINRRYKERQGILAELTDFSGTGGETLRSLRRFFSRFGYVELEADETIGGERALVMVKPIRGTEELGKVSHRLLMDFYSRVLSPYELGRMLEIRPVRES